MPPVWGAANGIWLAILYYPAWLLADNLFYSVYLDTGDEPNISTRSKDILEWSKDMVRQLMGVETVDDEEINVENFVENFVQTSPETVRPRTIGW